MKTIIYANIALLMYVAVPLVAQSTAGINVSSPSQTLTLAQAEQLAIKNNPRVAVGRLLALAEGQAVREARASELPTITGNLTAVDSHTGSRVTAGALNNPVVYERAAGGITVSQLITDFGRTRSLVGSADLHAKAQTSALAATSADVVLAVDQTFYRALGSQEVLKVAQQTVSARQTTSDQINALAGAKLKSSLDLSFANVNLSEAKLLLLDAQNANADAMAVLNALVGEERPVVYTLSTRRQLPHHRHPKMRSLLSHRHFRDARI